MTIQDAAADHRPSEVPKAISHLVQLEGITKSFGPVRALRGVDFDLRPGEVHALLGQNGAGKSTLIKILSGVNQPDSGVIRVQGRQVSFRDPADSRAAGLAVVYQELSLVPSMSVAANLYLGREPRNRAGMVRQRRLLRETKQFLDQHGLPLDPRARVDSLPFAYRQLTEIAKALSGNVQILVLDEPTSALSGGEEEILFDAISQVTARGVGVVYVTHRLGEVFRLSDRVTVFRDGANVGTFDTAATTMASLVSSIVGPKNDSIQQMTLVGLGPRGEAPVSPDALVLTEDESTMARAGAFKVGVLLHTDSDWSRQQLAGIRATLDEHGAQVTQVRDSHFDPSEQIRAIDAMILDHPDAIISVPVDDTLTADAHARISKSGIKLVLADHAPDALQAFTDYVTVVSADNAGIGSKAAEALARHVPTGGVVGIVEFAADFAPTAQRAVAFARWMGDHRSDVRLVRTGFDAPADAEKVTKVLLQEFPQLEGLFIVWDDPAVGALRALRDTGRLLPVATVDLGSQIARELAEGSLVVSVTAQQPYLQGRAEALAALGAMIGKQAPPWVVLPGIPATRDNVLQVFETIWHAPAPLPLVEARAKSPDHALPRKGAARKESPDEPTGPVPLLQMVGVRNEQLHGVDLNLRAGEILGLAGMMGSGRTEIFETLFGLRPVTSGQILLRGENYAPRTPYQAIQQGVALAPEDRHEQGLVLAHSIERNIALPRLNRLGQLGWFRRGAARQRAVSAIDELSIKAPGPSTEVRNLSGGNQQKVVFGKWRDPAPLVLLLDEPTIGVDVGAREDIYDVIRRATESGSGALVVSSDFVELLLLCDRIAIVANGRVVDHITRAEVENEEHLHRLVQEAQE